MNGVTGSGALNFERPIFLLLAGLLPFVIIILRRFLRPPLTIKLSLGAQGGKLWTPPASSQIGVYLILAAEIAAAVLLMIILASPVKVSIMPVYKDRGADVIFVLDISPSMAALDINASAVGLKPQDESGMVSRFEAARALILALAEQNSAAAVGLAAVGEEAALLIPATIDREAFRTRLESIKLGELGDGTALGLGLSLAAFHLKDSTAPRRACFLVTDGENNRGAVHPEAAAQAISQLGLDFFVLGIGSGGEVMLDYTDPWTEQRRRGMFDSRYNTESLAAIAESGGGAFLEARTGGELARAFLKLNESAFVPVQVDTLKISESQSFFLLIAAFGLLIFAVIGRYTVFAQKFFKK